MTFAGLRKFVLASGVFFADLPITFSFNNCMQPPSALVVSISRGTAASAEYHAPVDPVTLRFTAAVHSEDFLTLEASLMQTISGIKRALLRKFGMIHRLPDLSLHFFGFISEKSERAESSVVGQRAGR
jgi:hypothetical protein